MLKLLLPLPNLNLPNQPPGRAFLHQQEWNVVGRAVERHTAKYKPTKCVGVH